MQKLMEMGKKKDFRLKKLNKKLTTNSQINKKFKFANSQLFI